MDMRISDLAQDTTITKTTFSPFLWFVPFHLPLHFQGSSETLKQRYLNAITISKTKGNVPSQTKQLSVYLEGKKLSIYLEGSVRLQ